MSKSRWILLTLCTFFVAATAVWLRLNHAPSQWDDSWYLTNSLVMFDALAEGGLPGYAAKYLTILRTKPPLITVLPTPVYLVLGRRVHAPFAVNLVAMLVIFLVLYAIGRRFRNERVGLIAIFIAGTMPLFYGLSRWFLVEYSLTAFVCLTVYLVIEALQSPGKRVLLLLGITCGLGMLLKSTYPLYVSPILLYLLARLIREGRWSMASLAALAAPVVLLPLPWYAVNYRAAVRQALIAGFSSDAARYGTGPVFAFSAISRYLLIVVNNCWTPYYLLLAGALLLCLALMRSLRTWWESWPKPARVLLVLWALPLPVFLFGRNKDVRFLAPIFPVLVLLLASLVDRAAGQTGRRTLAVATLLLGFPLFAFLHTSFGAAADTRIEVGGFAFLAPELGYANRYRTETWPHRAVLEQALGVASANTSLKKP